MAHTIRPFFRFLLPRHVTYNGSTFHCRQKREDVGHHDTSQPPAG